MPLASNPESSTAKASHRRDCRISTGNTVAWSRVALAIHGNDATGITRTKAADVEQASQTEQTTFNLLAAAEPQLSHPSRQFSGEDISVTDHYQLNLGSLRSSITLTLHTHHAARIWQGRAARDGVRSIMGMAGYISVTNLIKQAAAQDDPYADWAMLQLEEKLMQAKAGMMALTQQLDRVKQDLPTQIDIGDNLNIHPVTLPLYIGSQLGFLAVYLLTDYDTLVRRTLLAHHTALIGRADMETWIDSGAHLLRSLFGLAQRYRLAAVTRDDMAAKNARAHEAIDKFGQPPQDILDGTRRSEFAPPIIRRASGPVDDAGTPADNTDELPLATAEPENES
jgi:integrating conjugative element protein (TIGR03761 family)